MKESAEAHSDSNDQLEVPATLPAADSDPVDLENPVENPKENSRKKASKRRVTLKQRMLMANFIIENPELITHSSTTENEIELWNDLHQKLNELTPERSLDSWKNFLSRWRYQLLTKTEDAMTATDYKLKQFLNKIITNDQIPNFQGSVKPAPKQTLHDVLDKIDEVEKERSNLRLEIDCYELRINKYKFLVRAMEDEIELKRARIKKLSDEKTYLNKRRRILQKRDNCDVEPTEFEETTENENETAQEQTEA